MGNGKQTGMMPLCINRGLIKLYRIASVCALTAVNLIINRGYMKSSTFSLHLKHNIKLLLLSLTMIIIIMVNQK